MLTVKGINRVPRDRMPFSSVSSLGYPFNESLCVCVCVCVCVYVCTVPTYSIYVYIYTCTYTPSPLIYSLIIGM